MLSLFVGLVACENANSNRQENTTASTSLSNSATSKLLSNQEVIHLQETYQGFLEKFTPKNMNCSGDPLDVFFTLSKKAENTFLNQFPISNADEEMYGEEFHRSISKEYRLIDEDSRRRKLQNMMNKMLPYRERKGINYNIHLIDHQMVNAFAIAGGHVYFTTGILNFVGSEDELAVIIGHEIGHVDKKHTIRKLQKLIIANNLLKDVGTLVANFQMVLTTPFGQVDEYEADRIGAYFAKKAGYNPRKGLNFWRKLKKRESYSVFGKIKRTHPYSSQREKCLEEYIRKNLD